MKFNKIWIKMNKINLLIMIYQNSRNNRRLNNNNQIMINNCHKTKDKTITSNSN